MFQFRLWINSILLCFLLVMLVILTALGGTKTKVLNEHEVDVLQDQFLKESLEAARQARLEHEERLVLVPQTAAVFAPDPDNAALLYYQAMLIQPRPDATTVELIYNVLRGNEPDERVRKYLRLQGCRKAIKLAEASTQIPECNWGILYSQGFGFNWEPFRDLYFLLDVDGRTLAADGDYSAALARCLILRQLCRHVQEVYPSSLDVDKRALASIRDILGAMPPDTDILTWLQGKLVSLPSGADSCAELLQKDFEFVIGLVRKEPDTLKTAKEYLVEKAADINSKKEILSLTDEELLARAHLSYVKFLNSILRVIGRHMPYEKTYVELQKLTDELEKQADRDPIVILKHCATQVCKFYNIQVRHEAEFNAIRSAIEIYINVSQTGQLPEKLPSYLPKDPYSGRDFEYEITDDGFLLRCRAKDLTTGRIHFFTFKVQGKKK